MDLQTAIGFVFICVSLVINIFAFVALTQSKNLAYHIKIFSINLTIADIGLSTGGIIFATKGFRMTSDTIDADCVPIIFAYYVNTLFFFVTSFLITAMGIDRYVSIVYPYRYLFFISVHKKRFIVVCILLWFLSLLVIFFHEIDNNWRLYFCMCGNYTQSVTHVGLQFSNLHAIGTTNLCLLIVNLVTYSAIIGKIWRQTTDMRGRQYSTLSKLFTFTITYALLHGPINVITIIMMIFESNFDYSSVIRIAQLLLALTMIVDPILYAWRYTDCRMEMMMLLCRWNPSYMDILRRKQNDFYSSYVIDIAVDTHM